MQKNSRATEKCRCCVERQNNQSVVDRCCGDDRCSLLPVSVSSTVSSESSGAALAAPPPPLALSNTSTVFSGHSLGETVGARFFCPTLPQESALYTSHMQNKKGCPFIQTAFLLCVCCKIKLHVKLYRAQCTYSF